MAVYSLTRDRVETYFDRTATRTWERLTSTEQVSRIRATVREGRERMRALMLSRLPADHPGARAHIARAVRASDIVLGGGALLGR